MSLLFMVIPQMVSLCSTSFCRFVQHLHHRGSELNKGGELTVGILVAGILAGDTVVVERRTAKIRNLFNKSLKLFGFFVRNFLFTTFIEHKSFAHRLLLLHRIWL